MSAAKGSIPWNKGTSQGWIDKRGYRWIYVEENGNRRARREHRVLMEGRLGRKLDPWEVVHHKDENPGNNAIENLEVKTFGEHTSMHHLGARRTYDSRRTMEAFALLREELKSERLLREELLAALQALANAVSPDGKDARCEQFFHAPLKAARAAIAKATS
jgi:hypothetical protein